MIHQDSEIREDNALKLLLVQGRAAEVGSFD